VILKPSELAPRTSNVLNELFAKYLDNSCYRVIEGKIEVAKNIIEKPFDLIFFTGSPEKGKLIAQVEFSSY
jgi:aldehyde dehydrogenase (NAD+)